MATNDFDATKLMEIGNLMIEDVSEEREECRDSADKATSAKTFRAEADKRFAEAREAHRISVAEVKASAEVQASLTRVNALDTEFREINSRWDEVDALHDEADARCKEALARYKEFAAKDKEAKTRLDEAYAPLCKAGDLIRCDMESIPLKDHDEAMKCLRNAMMQVDEAHASSHQAFKHRMAMFEKCIELDKELDAHQVDDDVVARREELCTLLDEAEKAHKKLVDTLLAPLHATLKAAKAQHAADLREAYKRDVETKRARNQAARQTVIDEAVKAALAEAEKRHEVMLVGQLKEIESLKKAKATAKAKAKVMAEEAKRAREAEEMASMRSREAEENADKRVREAEETAEKRVREAWESATKAWESDSEGADGEDADDGTNATNGEDAYANVDITDVIED